ncbi:MAG: asparagine synthase-related protein [Solirubrobacteraceae bacterium]
MIVEHGSVRSQAGAEHTLELPDHTLHWCGFAYLPGVAPGAASLAACDWGSGLGGVIGAARTLKGSYAVSVLERSGAHHYFFTDPGGHLQAFGAGSTVSTSFLALCDAGSVSFADSDPYAIAELLDLGNLYGQRTLVPSIRLLPAGRVYEMAAGEAPLSHDAGIPAIDAPPPRGLTVEGFFDGLCSSVHGMRVSVDLTGGSDSRLVATLLARDRGLDLECAVTGVAGYADIEIARRVAEALGRPLHVHHHEISHLEAEIPDLFESSDALCDLLTFHRPRQNTLARRERGVQVAISGAGGELYKDFWWLQDLPRYRSANSRLERLFDLRFRAVGLPVELLQGDYAAAAAQVRARTLGAMRDLVMPLNTQTYDRIYYEMKMRAVAARFISMTSRLLACDSPLLDPELVRVGYALPRTERFYNRFHRHTLTAVNPQVARLGTGEGGMSLSSEPVRQALDAASYTRDKLRRLAAKTREHVGHAPLRQQRPDHPDLVKTARASAAFGASVRRLRAHGVLSSAADEATLPDRYVGRILTLGLLAQRLDG